jgi:hypothetical protein
MRIKNPEKTDQIKLTFMVAIKWAVTGGGPKVVEPPVRLLGLTGINEIIRFFFISQKKSTSCSHKSISIKKL